MSRSIVITAFVVLGVVVLAALAALVVTTTNLNTMLGAPSGVTVQGEGRVQASPDVAQITVGVTTQAPTAQDALEQSSASTERVVQAIRAQGISEKDLQTQGLRSLCRIT